MFKNAWIILFIFAACKSDRASQPGVYASCVVTRGGGGSKEAHGDHDHGGEEIALPLEDKGTCPIGGAIRLSTTMPGKGEVGVLMTIAGKEFRGIATRGEDVRVPGELQLRGIVPGKHELRVIFDDANLVKLMTITVK